MKTAWRIAFLAAALTLAGCATVQIKETPQSAAPIGVARIAAGQAVAILTFAATESDLEAEAFGCIRDAVAAVHPGVGVMSADDFRRAVFPYRIPDDETERAKYLDLLMGQPVLRERMASLKIRYLILLQGNTEMKKKGGGFGGAGPGGGFYIFLYTWDRNTELVVSILDVTESRPVTQLHAEASGTPWLFSVQIIFTIGAPAFTEAQACRGIGQAIAKFLSGESFERIQNGEENREK